MSGHDTESQTEKKLDQHVEYEHVVSRWMRPAPSFLATLVLLLLSFVFFIFNFKHQYQLLPTPAAEQIKLFNSTAANNVDSRRYADLFLHPEHHVSREPNTLRFSWNISKSIIAPDGVSKEVFLINDQFPGPTIEARSNDVLEIKIINSAQEDISLHWHGLHMKGANSMDGPVGLTQCPIKSGSNFTYRVPIGDQSGTFWYHAHSEVHRGDGLYGGLIVHNPSTAENSTYQYDKEVLLLVGDWFHRPASDVLAWFQDRSSMGNEPPPNSLLVNGRGHFDCSKVTNGAPVPCTSIEPPRFSLNNELRYRVRVINVGSMAGVSLTVPDAELKVFQVDGGLPVTSNISNSIGILYPAERVDFTLSWTNSDTSTESQIIFEVDKELFYFKHYALPLIQSFPLTAAKQNQNHQQEQSTKETSLQRCNLRELKGEILDEPLPEPQATYMIYTAVQVMNQLDDEARALINHTIWEAQSLPLITLSRDKWDNNQVVPWTGTEPVWVEFVINNVDVNGHPFHLHGFNFYVVASYGSKNGFNAYNPYDPSMPRRGGPFNLIDPLHKDTVYVPPNGYVVLRFLADNEGIWALHCHILWHQASGMTMALQVLGDEKKGFSASTAGIEAGKHCVANLNR